MRLDELGEFGLIERFAAKTTGQEEPGLVGIGDDCAVFPRSSGQDMLLTTDMLVEGVHFLREKTTPHLLGRKSLAVNLSDIAACGGTPRHAVVSVALPADVDVEYAETLFRGMDECAREYGVRIVGGDTTSSPKGLVINVALTGEIKHGQAILRSGASQGNAVFISGPVGDAAAGLEIITRHEQWAGEYEYLLAAYHNPTPHVAEGQEIGKSGRVTAMIDVSDGVAADLTHLCRASGLGARIFADKLPKSTALRNYASRAELDIHDFAISGGEDYVLLFTVSPANQAIIANTLAEKCFRPIHQIGEITAGPDLEYVLPDGRIEPLKSRGWNHFAAER